MRCPTRVARLASWRRTIRIVAPARPPAGFLQNRAGRNVDRAPLRIDRDILTGIAGECVCDGDAIAWTDECLQAVEQRPGGVRARKFDGFADVPGDADGKTFDGGFNGVRPVDALGDRGCEFLRLLRIGERLEPVRPTRLVRDLLDRDVDLRVDDLVEVVVSPLISDERLVIDSLGAIRDRVGGDRDDRGSETGIVSRLAGFVIGAADSLRRGRRQRHLARYDGNDDEQRNGQTHRSDHLNPVLGRRRSSGCVALSSAASIIS